MKNPIITVLMPVYNIEKYVNEAIDSVLNQTFSDFELLIIDDGSSDKTLEQVKKYSDSRIQLVEKPMNTGLIDCLNLGFNLAKGKYIARMDGDDISDLTRFDKQLAVLEKHPEIQVCGCCLKEFGKKNGIIKQKEFHDEIVANMLLHCSMSMGAVMYDREALIAFRFDKNKEHVEDYDYWSRVAWSCKFYNIQEILYYYRVHETQVSTVYLEEQIRGDIEIKLFLFKKLHYNTKRFSDELITKMLLLKDYITVKEFSLFDKWIKELTLLNSKSLVFSQNEFEKVLGVIKKKLFYSVYFSNTTIGITKKWRIKALFKLSIKDIVYILKIKSRELKKTFFKNA